MKRFATAALVAALASAGAMASAQEIKPAEPVVSTQGVTSIPPLALIGGLTAILIIVAADSSDGT